MSEQTHLSNSFIPAQVSSVAPDGKPTPRQARRILLNMARRRQKPGTGSPREFLQRRTAVNPWPDLRAILDGIHWALVGGVATRAYMPERMTQDMDILIHQRDDEAARHRLQTAGYTGYAPLAVPGFTLQSPEGVPLDVLLGHAPWVAEALQQPNYDLAGYPVIGLPYLVLLKMEAARPQDSADVTRMLGSASEAQLAEVRAVIARYSPIDSEDIETLIYLGKLEMQPPPSES